MSRDLYILLALIVVGATWLVAQLSCWLSAARSGRVWRPLRFVAWLPPLSPVLSWIAGRRLLCTLWFLHALVYSVLWRLS